MKWFLWIAVLGVTLAVAPLPPGTEAVAKDEPQGFRGRIFYRDGSSVEFLHLGSVGLIREHEFDGYMGQQRVEYRIGDLSKLVFADQDCDYDDHQGDLIIFNKAGERFTLTQARLWSSDGGIRYVFADPVTNRPKATFAPIKGKISHIEVGATKGVQKRNPKSGEYYPSFYEYDPFTGDRLEWATRD